MKDLKERAIRGGFAKVCAQAANFLLRLCSVMALARLLTPRDFGLVGMVTALTGVLSLFHDFGLSSAAIQRVTVTEEQISTLFWINMVVGAILSLLTFFMAPFIAGFYHEPRLLGVTAMLGAGFLFNAAGVQHGALLQRQMRFTTVAGIDTLSLVLSVAVGIGMAFRGYGYWALVVMTVSLPLTGTLGLWLANTWIPGAPRRGIGIRSMMRFGGTLTLNGLILYIASNFEKVLLGRFWGAEALGIYGRAYQLIRIPTDNLNSAVGEVAFSALSRIQDDPSRLKSYFLKGYALVLGFTVSITIACALFADDIVLVLLGPKWKEAVPIFRLLAPTMLIFAITNPLGWLLNSIGLVGRGLKIALVIAPLMVASYIVGLPYGPRGVAFAYSAVMMVWVVPVIIWAVQGTAISFWDVLRATRPPLASIIPAASFGFGIHLLLGQTGSPWLRLFLEALVLFTTYFGVLLFVAGQKLLYLDLLRGLASSSSVKPKGLVSA